MKGNVPFGECRVRIRVFPDPNSLSCYLLCRACLRSFRGRLGVIRGLLIRGFLLISERLFALVLRRSGRLDRFKVRICQSGIRRGGLERQELLQDRHGLRHRGFGAHVGKRNLKHRALVRSDLYRASS